jgi:hypothetical protein
MLLAARQKDRDVHASGESAKLGTLRAGTTGIMSDTGDIAGQCHRKAHLRSLGMEIDPPTPDRLIMFELGFANEQVIYDQLVSVIKDDTRQLVILQEEEIPIKWTTSNGTVVSGRPDIVICERGTATRPEGESTIPTPILGIELKSIHSMWTAREVLFNKHPKMDHMVQSAHYMWKLGIPYKLIYKSYSQLGQGTAGGKDGWVVKQFPKVGEPMSEYVEYNDKGGMKHIRQFEIVYDLRIDTHGRIQFRQEPRDGVEDNTAWTNTIITTQDIERYFEFVSKMATEQQLGPRPMTLGTDGKKANYSSCNYCPLKPVCDETDKKKYSYQDWLALVTKEIGK